MLASNISLYALTYYLKSLGYLHSQLLLVYITLEFFFLLSFLLIAITFFKKCLLSCFSHVQLCNPTDCSPPDSSVHEIFQARIPEWVAISSSRRSSQPRDRTCITVSPYCWWDFTAEPSRRPDNSNTATTTND